MAKIDELLQAGIDDDETEKKLRKLFSEKPTSVPGTVRNLIGSEHANAIVAALTHEELVDFEILVRNGQFLTKDEAIQYLSQLPEFIQIGKELRNGAEKSAERIGKINLQTVAKELTATTYTEIRKMQIPKDRVRELRKILDANISFFRALTIGTSYSQRNELVDATGMYHLRLIFLELFQILATQYGPDAVDRAVAVIKTVIKLPPELEAAILGTPQNLREFRTNEACARLQSYIVQMESQFGPYQAKKSWEELREMVMFRKVVSEEFEDGDLRVGVYGDDVWSEGRLNMGFPLQINVNGLKLELPYPDTDGQILLPPPNPNRFQIYIDSTTGEICSHSFHLPLHRLMESEIYERIKNYVYCLFEKYLASFEPNIDDLFRSSANLAPVKKRRVATSEAIVACVDSAGGDAEDTEGDTNERFEPTYIHVPYVPSSKEVVEITTHTSDDDSLSAEERTKRKEYMRQLSGIKADRVRRVLVKFLGEPLRERSSHKMFRCRDTNGNLTSKTAPIALHKTDPVDFVMLYKALLRFGISLEEFCENL